MPARSLLLRSTPASTVLEPHIIASADTTAHSEMLIIAAASPEMTSRVSAKTASESEQHGSYSKVTAVLSSGPGPGDCPRYDDVQHVVK